MIIREHTLSNSKYSSPDDLCIKMNNRFTLAVLPRTQRGSGLVLDAHPDGSKFIYCHGHSVVIREFDSPQYADVYTQHATDVTCARYSPSGFYIASADKSG